MKNLIVFLGGGVGEHSSCFPFPWIRHWIGKRYQVIGNNVNKILWMRHEVDSDLAVKYSVNGFKNILAMISIRLLLIVSE